MKLNKELFLENIYCWGIRELNYPLYFLINTNKRRRYANEVLVLFCTIFTGCSGLC